MGWTWLPDPAQPFQSLTSEPIFSIVSRSSWPHQMRGKDENPQKARPPSSIVGRALEVGADPSSASLYTAMEPPCAHSVPKIARPPPSQAGPMPARGPSSLRDRGLGLQRPWPVTGPPVGALTFLGGGGAAALTWVWGEWLQLGWPDGILHPGGTVGEAPPGVRSLAQPVGLACDRRRRALQTDGGTRSQPLVPRVPPLERGDSRWCPGERFLPWRLCGHVNKLGQNIVSTNCMTLRMSV